MRSSATPGGVRTSALPGGGCSAVWRCVAAVTTARQFGSTTAIVTQQVRQYGRISAATTPTCRGRRVSVIGVCRRGSLHGSAVTTRETYSLTTGGQTWA